jgi:hypothetical protein
MSRDIDRVIEAVKREFPDVLVSQLNVVHPGVDDDGIWFFKRPNSNSEVQFESSHGTFPFLVESNQHTECRQINALSDALEIIRLWLPMTKR